MTTAERLAEIQAEPRLVRGPWQWHQARLPSGETVVGYA